MTARPPSRRHWRSDGTEPLPSGPAALGEPLAGGRCGKDRMVSETHLQHGADMPIRDLLNRVRHDGCGGRAGEAELLTVAAILSLLICVAAEVASKNRTGV
jgi:hypothetical protein